MMIPRVGWTILTLFLALTFLPSQQNVTSVSSPRADMIAVWQHQDLLICAPYPACVFDDWDIWYSLWDGATETWWTPTGAQAAPLAKIEGDDTDPAVAFDRNGNAMVVWAHNQSQQFDIYYSTWNRISWSAPAVVDALTGDDTDPTVAFDDNGYALVLWVHDESSIYYALWNGAGWTGHPIGQRIVRDWPSNFNGTSLPEAAFTNTPAPAGSFTTHQAVAVWTQLYQDPVPRSRIYYDIWNGALWSLSPPPAVPGQVENATLGDGFMATFRIGLSTGPQGTAMAVWGTASPDKPLYHSVWNGTTGAWTIASSFAPKGTTPAVAYGPHGRAMAVYSSLTAPGQVDIWESQYSQGVWTAGKPAADSSVWDRRPSIASFGIKAVALWWIEHLTFRNSEVFYAVWNSSDDSWSPASSLVGSVRQPFPSQPSGLQGNDRNPAVASNTGSPATPPRRHDIAVVSVTRSTALVSGGFVTVWATISNQGDFAETFNANAHFDQSLIGTLAGISLGPGSSTTISFNWNTAGVSPGLYVVSVDATPVVGEDDLLDNWFQDGTVLVAAATGGGGGRIAVM